MTGFEKIQKMGYKGANNPLAIYMWLIIEKNIFPELYFSLFDKKWHMNNKWKDTKNGKVCDWEYTDKPFENYKAAVAHVVDVIIKLM